MRPTSLWVSSSVALEGSVAARLKLGMGEWGPDHAMVFTTISVPSLHGSGMTEMKSRINSSSVMAMVPTRSEVSQQSIALKGFWGSLLRCFGRSRI